MLTGLNDHVATADVDIVVRLSNHALRCEAFLHLLLAK
jgi:hypothetical protein